MKINPQKTGLDRTYMPKLDQNEQTKRNTHLTDIDAIVRL